MRPQIVPMANVGILLETRLVVMAPPARERVERFLDYTYERFSNLQS